MSRKILSLCLALVILTLQATTLVYADGVTLNSYGIYSGDTELTEFVTGDIYARVDATNSGNRIVATLMLYKGGVLTDITMAASDTNTLQTPPLKITEVTEDMTLKLCIITDLSVPTVETKEYKGTTVTSPTVSFDKSKYYRIKSSSLGKHLYDNGTQVMYDTFQSRDAYLWKITANADGSFSMQNKGTGNYLSSSADGTKVVCKEPDEKGLTNWIINKIDEGSYGMKNVRNKKYINVQNASGFPQCNVTKEPSAYTNWTSHWVITDSSISVAKEKEEFKDYNPADYNPDLISIITPEYYSDVNGDVRVRFYAPFASYITAKCFAPEGEYGKQVEVAVAPVNEDGFGAFTFHADQFPHGPINIKMWATGQHNDVCCLMLYNTGGVPFNEGADAYGQPEFAEGLELVYVDDFTNPDLKIGDGGGINDLYYSHCPSGGDYSGLPFTDFNSGDRNPFSQRDTYMLIRADEKKNSSGLISSIDASNNGMAFRAPVYFECRFICQNAIGTWPAFWFLTTNEETGMRNQPGDELDTIEAYGVENLGDQNHWGYYVGYHKWGRPNSADNTGEGRFVNTTELSSGGTFDTDPHIYGLYVGTEEMIYTYDNIEVWRAKTPEYAQVDPIYYLINLAVGGSSGWPIDLSRYDYKADMYVDWVKVWSKPESVFKQ